jgi:hypothetical protein
MTATYTPRRKPTTSTRSRHNEPQSPQNRQPQPDRTTACKRSGTIRPPADVAQQSMRPFLADPLRAGASGELYAPARVDLALTRAVRPSRRGRGAGAYVGSRTGREDPTAGSVQRWTRARAPSCDALLHRGAPRPLAGRPCSNSSGGTRAACGARTTRREPTGRLELPTSRLQGERCYQLSYVGRIFGMVSPPTLP